MSHSPSAPLEGNRDLVRRYFRAISTGDLEELESLIAGDLRLRCTVGSGSRSLLEIDSFDALVRDLRRREGEIYERNVGIQPEILNLTAEGDRVAAEVRIRGLSAKTGAPYDNLYAFFFWIRGGLIQEIHEHLDTAYVGKTLLASAIRP